jgi:hypothetical protein
MIITIGSGKATSPISDQMIGATLTFGIVGIPVMKKDLINRLRFEKLRIAPSDSHGHVRCETANDGFAVDLLLHSHVRLV